MNFFTADEHYEHDNSNGGIIFMCNRPFKNLVEMREALIDNHNSVVKKGDHTFHLGDMFWKHCSEELARKILKSLNGQHSIVWGNHDEVASKIVDAFRGNYQATSFSQAGYRSVWLSHYAHRVWPGSHKGTYHLFGHTHGVLPDHRRSHDAGVDANNYFPISQDQLRTMMEAKGTLPPDEIELDMLAHPWPNKEPDQPGEKAFPLCHLPEGSH